MVEKIAYGLVALVAMTALAVAPGAAADIVDEKRCTGDVSPQVEEIVDECVHVRVAPDEGCTLTVWVDGRGGLHCQL